MGGIASARVRGWRLEASAPSPGDLFAARKVPGAKQLREAIGLRPQQARGAPAVALQGAGKAACANLRIVERAQHRFQPLSERPYDNDSTDYVVTTYLYGHSRGACAKRERSCLRIPSTSWPSLSGRASWLR